MEKIREVRSAVDDIDEEILNLLEMRQRLTAQIQNWKDLGGLESVDADRQTEIITRLKEKNFNVSHSLIESIWSQIFKDTIS